MCNNCETCRRSCLGALAGTAAAGAFAVTSSGTTRGADVGAHGDLPNAALPATGMQLDLKRVAVIDPRVDFIGPKSPAWPVGGESM
ncbi:hypothetical protein [Sinorhizobium mexicanum]|uniref:Uncharacterized protein n=1 Tax=Sinorhizobium mexicanum TaxID=375549 RepID=A0A859QRJ6_9HYPH|nr:hypothetical protein [Sinorhizobium mexicanum]MBP1884413.1 hypothetical protein [Sinorhizobium mexicanum]QLL65350.1 hypothetical protein FKV68_28795 [Sinorhizobium mexicanum]